MRTLKFIIMVALAIGLALLLGAPASALGEGDVGVTPSAWTLVVDAGAWQVINLLVVPLVHGLLIKAQASSRLKVVATLAITGLSTLLAAFVTGTDGNVTIGSAGLTMWAISFGIAIVGHVGLYKPIGVTGSGSMANLGVGAPKPAA